MKLSQAQKVRIFRPFSPKFAGDPRTTLVRLNAKESPVMTCIVCCKLAGRLGLESHLLNILILLSRCICVYDRPCRIADRKRQPTWPRGEVPVRTYFPNPASKIGARHTANRILLAIGEFPGQLDSRLSGFAEKSLWCIGNTQAQPIAVKLIILQCQHIS